MDEKKILKHIENIKIWQKNGKRAPNKPLLLLFALGRIQRGEPQMMRYESIKGDFKELLADFGMPSKQHNTHDPFIRLINDNIWTLSKDATNAATTNKWLRENNVSGGFNDDVYQMLLDSPSLVVEAAQVILNKHFPRSIHEDILDAVGLNLEGQLYESYSDKKGYGINDDNDTYIAKIRIRDPNFRIKVLRAYEQRCAVCDVSIRLGNQLIGIEAAHIKWHTALGPDIEANGLALCSVHHKLFDRGAYTLSDSNRLVVSQEVSGSSGFDEWLLKYHNKPIADPIDIDYRPADEYIEWHQEQVFRKPGRR